MPALVFVMFAAVLTFAHSTVFAEDNPITDEQLVQVKNNCSGIQSVLSQVHINDTLTRVNRGQLYESIATNLMAPFSSRVSLNRLDSTNLVLATNSYQNHLQQFRDNYQDYEELLSQTMKIDCVNEPTRFYEKLQQTRKARLRVNKSTNDITNDIKQYQRAFEEFVKSEEGLN